MNKLENVEAGIDLTRLPILHELFRIGQKQFEWQRGYFNAMQIYRNVFVYGGPKSREYFRLRHGVSLENFVYVGFALYAAFRENVLIEQKIDLSAVGITNSDRDASVRMITIDAESAIIRTKHLYNPSFPVEYQQSTFHQYPCIMHSQNRTLFSPLPELIINRITTGLFYDLVDGPQELKTEAGHRFELYAMKLLDRALINFSATPSIKYRFKKNPIDSPDVLVTKSGKLKIVVECKARRMPFNAKFGSELLDNAEASLSELAKGVYQIWRFFAHCRQGLVMDYRSDADVLGILITLDTWLSHSSELQKIVLNRAKKLCYARDEYIMDCDMKDIVFCAVHELEEVLSVIACDDDFFDVLNASKEENYSGWSLPSIRDKIFGEDRGERYKKPYPFLSELDELLPWRVAIRDRGGDSKIS